MYDRLLARVENLQNVIRVAAHIEEVADVEPLQMLVAVQLLLVGEGDGLEPLLVLGHQHGNGVSPEVGARHRYDVGPVPVHELADVDSELVVWIGRNMMELVYCNEAVVEGGHPEFVYGKSEGRVRAD